MKKAGNWEWNRKQLPAIVRANNWGLNCPKIIANSQEELEAAKLEAEKRAAELKIAQDKKNARIEKAFNECMFKNIKPSSNDAHYRIVRKYCKDQAGD